MAPRSQRIQYAIGYTDNVGGGSGNWDFFGIDVGLVVLVVAVNVV